MINYDKKQANSIRNNILENCELNEDEVIVKTDISELDGRARSASNGIAHVVLIKMPTTKKDLYYCKNIADKHGLVYNEKSNKYYEYIEIRIG